jgi:hypothetical protein
MLTEGCSSTCRMGILWRCIKSRSVAEIFNPSKRGNHRLGVA